MKIIITLLTSLLLTGSALAGERAPDYLPDELGWDDGTFESFGTSDDWAEMAVGLFSPGGDCSAFLTSIRIYGWGDTPREILIDTEADFDNPPAGLRGTGIFFNPGTTSADEAGWIDVDVSSLLVYVFPSEVIAIGVGMEGNSGMGLDDSCGLGDCGHYWTRRDGLWEKESVYGRNIGMRVILPGTCQPTLSGTISTIKSLYK